MPEPITTTQFAAALRALADIYEAHPEIILPFRPSFVFSGATQREFVGLAEALAIVHDASTPGDYFFTAERDFSGVPIQFKVARDIVGRPVTVTKEVTEWKPCPELEALCS